MAPRRSSRSKRPLREQTKVPSLRVKFTRVFGWYVEVTKSHLSKVPKSWKRKQTVASGERFTLDELDELAAALEESEEGASRREQTLFDELVRQAKQAAERIRILAGRIAAWDVASTLAEVAHRNDYVRPDVDGGDTIHIEQGRHPVVERLAERGTFVPNDTVLDLGGEYLWLVTGPNMAGKSTLMRQVALICLLAQMGSYVPATSARIGVVDRVLSRVGASDNLARGESTFMVEMRETASILTHATRRSLVILDEIGRGTSTYDGLAIAWAVAEHLHDVVRCRSLFATHYHELTELSKKAHGLANVSVAARELGEDVVFLHALTRGPASRSYGVAVAKLAGLPAAVVDRAAQLLDHYESTSAGQRLGADTTAAAPQLELFARPVPKHDDLLDEIRSISVETTTPMQALQLVAAWQKKLQTQSQDQTGDTSTGAGPPKAPAKRRNQTTSKAT